MKYGFTGSQNGAPVEVVHDELSSIPWKRDDWCVTGCCIGVDSQVFWWVLNHQPKVKHLVVVPDNRSKIDRTILECQRKWVRILLMPEGSTYRDRNIRLVHESKKVTAFWTGVQRSGTYMTINIAERAGKLRKIVRI